MTSSRASERQIEEHVRRHAGILSNAEATILVTVPEARGVARLLEARVSGLRRVVTVAELKENGGEPLPVPIGPEDIAFKPLPFARCAATLGADAQPMRIQ